MSIVQQQAVDIDNPFEAYDYDYPEYYPNEIQEGNVDHLDSYPNSMYKPKYRRRHHGNYPHSVKKNYKYFPRHFKTLPLHPQ